ncbi:Holliday junction ATP-dependent DNA helicase RuvB [Planctomycetes bacterium Pan216]|uniref:Holliday junction branch migration complex subunit RuvB n=1 Tax=Kolteria novifilia TaxID=2527975 RepID=A0A518BBV5_9BACT|nr:Holliday junction ATP-dependent DNA helicase RuvB [Planctomycetes bacterium Pan216]
MARQRMISSDSSDTSSSQPVPAAKESVPDDSLRPSKLADMIGQRAVIERLDILVDAARKQAECLPHILFDGPPGLGKTTLATVLPKEMGVELTLASGASLSSPKEIMPYLTNLTDHGVLFIDEIHRLPKSVEEFLYTAMEDFRIDIVLGEGLGARTLSMPLKRFSLIGATTRSGMLSAPLRDRFQVREHLDFYELDELARIVSINARKLGVPIDETSTSELARRSRGTPRIANSLLFWVRNFAISRGDGTITLSITRQALEMQQVDIAGLDKQDRRYLETLVSVFGGGPRGIDAIAATMNIPSETLSEEVEPFLLREGFIIRTPQGRRATSKAIDHLGRSGPASPPGGGLF